MNKHIDPIFVVDTDDYDSSRIIKKTYLSKTTGAEYEIMNLRKDVVVDIESDMNNAKPISHYRSVICRNGRVLAIGVPKGLEFDAFTEKYPIGVDSWDSPANIDVVNVDDLYINETVEGTMINLFFDDDNQIWEIATKGAVGGNYWFFRTQYTTVGVDCAQLEFRKMFLEACGVMVDVNEIPFLAGFNKKMIYSFVLQHPLNHIVGWNDVPILYLVGVYFNQRNIVEYISPTLYEKWDTFSNTPIRFPNRIRNFKGYDDLYKSVQSCEFMSMGAMITHIQSGDRCRVDNMAYLESLNIRGNNPNLQYHYLKLLKTGGVLEFLQFFPGYSGIFHLFYEKYAEFVEGIYRAYVDRYILKIVGEVNRKYMPHIWRLHNQVYVPSLINGSRIVIRKEIVEKYVMGLEVKEILYYINL